VVKHGVTIIGAVNVANGVPFHASQVYAKNLTTFLLNLVKEGKVRPETEDDIIRDTLLTRGGEVLNQRVREFFPALSAATPK
jgi:NAD(P) transhydrogenase subunit alpha